MLNIKEIALKVAMDTGLYLDGANQSEPFYVVKPEEIVEFAEALIAELAKQNEPVAYGWIEDGELKALSFADIQFKPIYSPSAIKSPLYTLPPTASQIEQGTAKACAELLESQHTWITKEAASALVRSGAWKDFKK